MPSGDEQLDDELSIRKEHTPIVTCKLLPVLGGQLEA